MSDTSTDTASDAAPPPRVRGLFGSARTLFTVRGVPVRADISLLLMAGFVIVTVARLYAGIPALAAGGTAAVAIAAVGFAVAFFGSILAHEFGHAFTSLDRGIPVAGITLFALGGVTESTREARRAGDEFVIVGIGPFISLVLAAAFGLLHVLVQDLPILAAITGYVAWMNLLLAIFNLVPGYPLDGGRLLRSILWRITGRPHQATRWAARVGQAFAAALVIFGASSFFGLQLSFSLGPLYLRGSLWEAFIGLFLFRGATDAYRSARLRERLAARSVRDLMGSVPPTLPADLSIGAAVSQVATRPSLLWPVGSPLSGAVTLDLLDRVAERDWGSMRLRDIALPPQRITVDVEASLDEAFQRLADAPGTMLIVVQGGQPVGLLTPSLVADVR